MRLVRAENANRAWRIGFESQTIRVKPVVFIVIAKKRLHIVNREFLLWRSKNWEGAPFGHKLLHRRAQKTLNFPNTRVVVVTIATVVSTIGLREIKFAVFFRVVEAMLLRKLDQRR